MQELLSAPSAALCDHLPHQGCQLSMPGSCLVAGTVRKMRLFSLKKTHNLLFQNHKKLINPLDFSQQDDEPLTSKSRLLLEQDVWKACRLLEFVYQEKAWGKCNQEIEEYWGGCVCVCLYCLHSDVFVHNTLQIFKMRIPWCEELYLRSHLQS